MGMRRRNRRRPMATKTWWCERRWTYHGIRKNLRARSGSSSPVTEDAPALAGWLVFAGSMSHFACWTELGTSLLQAQSAAVSAPRVTALRLLDFLSETRESRESRESRGGYQIIGGTCSKHV